MRPNLLITDYFRSPDHERQQAEEARALDRPGQFALLLCRHRGDAARHDLAALGDVALQQLRVLVVDLRRVGAGEGAGLATAEERPARGYLGKTHRPCSSSADAGAASSVPSRGGRA